MPDIPFPETSNTLTAEACGWIAQLETGDMSREDISALREWVSRSPKHFAELKRIAILSGETNVLAQLSAPIDEAIADQRKVLRQSRPLLIRYARPLALATVALGLVGLVTLSIPNATPPQSPYIIATQIGGFSEETLSDGSIVKLNTNSQIEVDFDASTRRIRLIKGEAFFDVTHDAGRPFIVAADDKFVKAIGTAFSVRWTEGDLTVVVADGRVAVAPLSELAKAIPIQKPNPDEIVDAVARAKAPVYLDAGQKISVLRQRPTKVVADVTPRDIRSELSWQSGILDFTDRPLEEIVDEVNRYTDIKIEISDPELRSLKFGGIFRTGETEQLFEALELSGLEVEHLSNTYVEIRKTSE